MSIDCTLGEAGSERDFVEGGDFEAAFGEQLQPGRHEQSASLGLTSLVNDSHEYLGYLSAPLAQDFGYLPVSKIPLGPLTELSVSLGLRFAARLHHSYALRRSNAVHHRRAVHKR